MEYTEYKFSKRNKFYSRHENRRIYDTTCLKFQMLRRSYKGRSQPQDPTRVGEMEKYSGFDMQ